MPWREQEDSEPDQRRAKVCVVCHKIILQADDLIRRDGKTYCSKHDPKG
jgi:hypothetical protein